MMLENVTYYVCPRCQCPMYRFGPLHVRCTHCINPANGLPLTKPVSEVQVLTADSIDSEPQDTYFQRLKELNNVE